MRTLIRLLGAVVALVLALGIALYFYVQDANRLKPELQALVAQQTGVELQLNGDLRWQLFPPLTLRAIDVQASQEDRTVSAGSLELDLNLSAVWSEARSWQVSALHLRDAVVTDPDSRTVITALDLEDFEPGKPAQLFVDGSYLSLRADDAKPLAGNLDGTITYLPASEDQGQRIKLDDARITSEQADGVCQIDATQQPYSGLVAESTPEDLLPLEILLNYDLIMDCHLERLAIGSETFTDAKLQLTNTAGSLNALLDVEDFLGGTLQNEVDINLRDTPVAWTVLPQMEGVDTQRLMDWTDQKAQWLASIASSGTIRMRGNTEAELANSIRAEQSFDAGQGQLNITKIKQQLMDVAILTQDTDKVETWPDVWQYEEFVGRWTIKGRRHALQFALDHMSIDATGTYNYLKDRANFLANITVHEAPEDSPFSINPMLQGTPIPIRCKGPNADIKCELDQTAATQVVARALRRDDESGLRNKIEQKIDEEVPEEYRDTARDLLDILGRVLDSSDDSADDAPSPDG